MAKTCVVVHWLLNSPKEKAIEIEIETVVIDIAMVEMDLVVEVAVVAQLQDRLNAITVVNVVTLPEIVDAKEEMIEGGAVVAEEVIVETEITIEEETDQEIDVTDLEIDQEIDLEIATDVMIVTEETETEVTIEIGVDANQKVFHDLNLNPDRDRQAMIEIKEAENVV
jgi:hypothetical protein